MHFLGVWLSLFIKSVRYNNKSSGNQLVIFFGSNSWSYTRRGHIEGLFTDELTALLDKDIAVIEMKTTKLTTSHKE